MILKAAHLAGASRFLQRWMDHGEQEESHSAQLLNYLLNDQEIEVIRDDPRVNELVARVEKLVYNSLSPVPNNFTRSISVSRDINIQKESEAVLHVLLPLTIPELLSLLVGISIHTFLAECDQNIHHRLLSQSYFNPRTLYGVRRKYRTRL